MKTQESKRFQPLTHKDEMNCVIKKYFSTLSLLFTNTYGSNKKQRRF